MPADTWKLDATGCYLNTTGNLGFAPYENADVMGVRFHVPVHEWAGKIRLLYCNWSNQSVAGDYYAAADGYGAVTGTCSVYSPDKSTQVGTGAISMLPGDTLAVDIVLDMPVPKGAPVFLGSFGQPATGCGIPVMGTPYGSGADTTAGTVYNLSGGEAAEFGTSGITDKTTALSTVGTSSPSATPVWGPTAILSMQPADTPVIVIHSDSKNAGFYIRTDAYGNVGWVAQAFGNSVAVMNFGCGGKNAVEDVTAGLMSPTLPNGAMDRRMALATEIGATRVVIDLGRNDASGGRTAAQIMADVTTIANKWASIGLEVWGVTQFPDHTGTWATVITDFNALLMACPAPFKGIIDAYSAVTTPTGAWITGWSPDQVHAADNAKAALTGIVPVKELSA